MNANTIKRMLSNNSDTIRAFMKKGKIPGVTIVAVNGEEEPVIRHFGYADWK
ncbi:MAG: beta-lactamase family protein, partial [bacterium]|nr:beta-lactamase family protein [bacterium]